MDPIAFRITAHAKVNLHLGIGGLRADGYHDVETILQSIGLADEVTIVAGVPFSFECSPDLGLDSESNLALRAARAMSERFSRALELAISVEKRVPAGAGLGGASADAAAVICGLARLWDVERTDARLREVAVSLGADVPFFLEGGAALFGGRGDVLKQSLSPLSAPMVVVKPEEPVPTAEAYAAYDRLGAQGSPVADGLIEALGSGDAAGVAAHLHNDMTPSSVLLVPAIADALCLVARHDGVLGSAMAGSGSAVFGICADRESAAECADTALRAGFWAVATSAWPCGCAVEHM
ncbi:MAG: 4-(cytidine 5'-diphospho)-2-C-methyl-D-erythritol kinase [Coriobacteriia bacterium]|nr:4-(cytidine 5'-diphospho)-2-C-methyl-D-erythritol kinase [Coriobacteriia bacterium]